MSRAVIAMAAVRLGACHQPGKITGHTDLFPPTDVMVITSLPWCQNSVGLTLYKKENNLLKPYIYLFKSYNTLNQPYDLA